MVKRMLADLAVIKAGHPFRGKIELIKDGNIKAIQIRDFDEYGCVLWNQVINTDITKSNRTNCLEKGDILFAARGLKNFAACINPISDSTVCGPHFFQIHIHDTNVLIPDFLTWVLNQKPAQRYFSKSAEGSAQLSIRKSVLENVEITIPSIENQESIVKLYQAFLQEKRVLKALINSREQEMNFIAQDILG